jgi:hypothetical protein
MSTHKNSVPYTASDIEKYRKGELSAREMYDLEQASLDDPFLADAIEGLLQHPNLQEDLTDLHNRLEAKLTRDTRRNRIIGIRRRSALAAALILLLGIGYTFFYRHPPPPEPAAIVRNTPSPAAQPPQSEAKAAADSLAVHDTPPANTPATAAVRHRLPETAAKHTDSLSPEARSDDKTTALSDNLVSTSTNNQLSPSSNNRLSPSSNNYLSPPTSNQASLPALRKVTIASRSYPTIPDLQKTLLENKLKSIQTGTHTDTAAYAGLGSVSQPIPIVLSGKVLDLDNHPLPGAFLALNDNSGLGTTTDEQGQFRISLHPFDSTRQLTVSMIGYDHASLAVNALGTGDLQNNVIHLKPNTSNFDEVVVTGYSKATEVIAPSDNGDEKLDTLWSNAIPVVGRDAYLQYLDVAKKKLGLDSTITGTETLSFIVSRNGALSSFKIERSLSPAHDAGIIRLVTDGPAWHLIRGKKVRASVTVNF